MSERFRFAFISRHTPTDEQFALAKMASIELIPVGDLEAFTVAPEDLEPFGQFDGAIVVHPAAAMRLAGDLIIGVYENASRTAEGGKPTFYAKSLQIYDLRD